MKLIKLISVGLLFVTGTNKRPTLIKLISVGLLFVAVTAITHAKPKWKKVTSRSGIVVYARDTPGSSMIEFKAQGIVKAQVPKIIALIQDISLMPKWVDDCYKSKELARNFSAQSYKMDFNKYRMTIYGANKVPWPFENRDYVLRGRISYDAKHDAAIMDLSNVKNAKMPPKKGLVRMPMMKTKLTLIPKHNDEHTWVQIYVHVDPGGNIPTWAVNWVTKKVPLRTLEKLRILAKRKKYNKEFEKLVWHHVNKVRKKAGKQTNTKYANKK